MAPPPPQLAAGHFLAPHAFEIDAITRLTGEVFGPDVKVRLQGYITGSYPA